MNGHSELEVALVGLRKDVWNWLAHERRLMADGAREERLRGDPMRMDHCMAGLDVARDRVFTLIDEAIKQATEEK